MAHAILLARGDRLRPNLALLQRHLLPPAAIEQARRPLDRVLPAFRQLSLEGDFPMPSGFRRLAAWKSDRDSWDDELAREARRGTKAVSPPASRWRSAAEVPVQLDLT